MTAEIASRFKIFSDNQGERNIFGSHRQDGNGLIT